MPKRTGSKPKGQRDVNQLARHVMQRIEELTEVAEQNPGKNPFAVAMGRQGGLKGGRSRMDAMTPEERKKLAVKAAKARWGRSASGKR